MKTKIIYFMMFVISSLFLSTAIFAQGYPHIPVEHDHSGGICWGYSTVRAFHYFGAEDTSCNPANATLTETLSQSNLFDYETWEDDESKDDVGLGDIIVWTGGEDHAAFIDNIEYNYNYSGIIVDQYDGSVKEGYTLQETIDGNENVTARGIPTGYYRLSGAQWNLTLDNVMGNTSGSNDKVQINSSTKYDAPHLYNVHWNKKYTLNGAMHGETYGGYVQRLDEWTYGSENVDLDLTIAWNATGNRK